MLTLNNVTINLQNFGTVLAIFLVGKSKVAIEERYFSFWNHCATGGELEWWSDTCALFWIHSNAKGTADEKLRWALVEAALAELRNKGFKGKNAWPVACDIAEERYTKIDHVTWYQTVKVWDMFDMGTSVAAEKGTGNFNDDVIAATLTRNGGTNLDLIKAKYTSDKEQREEEGDADAYLSIVKEPLLKEINSRGKGKHEDQSKDVQLESVS